jgi:hypothetical protein
MNETDFELASEYEFDYAKAKPNRFANSTDELKVVVLDEDVAKVLPPQHR